MGSLLQKQKAPLRRFGGGPRESPRGLVRLLRRAPPDRRIEIPGELGGGGERREHQGKESTPSVKPSSAPKTLLGPDLASQRPPGGPTSSCAIFGSTRRSRSSAAKALRRSPAESYARTRPFRACGSSGRRRSVRS